MKKVLIAIMCMVLVFCYTPIMAFAEGSGTSGGTDIYVSADGNDETGDGTEVKPYASLNKAAEVVNAGAGENFTVHVMSDLTSTACARFYNKNVTIVGEGTTVPVVSRGDGFDTQSDTARSWYNPAMLEVQTSEGPASLTLKNIIFDDCGKHMGTVFKQAVSGEEKEDNTVYVQDAIVASNATEDCTVTLGEGAVLRNYGGMSAVRVTDKAKLVMESGSVIEDTTVTDRKSGQSAVWLQDGSFTMNEGSKITKTAGKNVILAQKASIKINGEISYNDTKGNHILQTDSNTITDIGASGNIHHNIVWYGAIYLNGQNEQMTIYGKINNNYSSNRGGGVVVSNNGNTNKNVTMYPGAEICNNVSTETGGGIMVSFGTFTMKGGKIAGNISGQEGGGVYVRRGGLFVMEDGVISGNRTASFGGGVAFSASDWGLLTPYADLKGGKISNNYMNATVSLKGFDTEANGGKDNDIAVASNDYGKTTRFLKVGSDTKLGDSNIYFVNGPKTVAPSAESLDIKLSNASPNSINALNAESLAKGWSEPLATFWMQRSQAATLTVGGLNDKINDERPIYAMALPVGEDGNPEENADVKVYVSQITDEGIKLTIPEGNTNGYAVALVQPTEDFGNVVITTSKSQIDKNKDKTADGNYEIPYTATYTMSKNLKENIELLKDRIDDNNCEFTFTVELDKRLTAESGAGDYKFTSPIFELKEFTVADDGSTVIAKCKLKADWKNHIDELLETPMVLTGTGVLGAEDFIVGDIINTTGHIEVSISAGNLNIYIPANVCQTLMKEEITPGPGTDPQDPGNTDEGAPKTGDATSMTLLMGLFMLAVAALAGSIFLKKSSTKK